MSTSMGNVAIIALITLFISLSLYPDITADQINPIASHQKHSSENHLHHRHRMRNRLNHRASPSLDLRYEESIDSVSWVPKPIIEEPYKYEQPPSLNVEFRPQNSISNHRIPSEDTNEGVSYGDPSPFDTDQHQSGVGDSRQPLDFSDYALGPHASQESPASVPDANYVGRVSYDLQKPHNTYEEEYPEYETHWPNHKYRPEFLPFTTTPPPPTQEVTTRRPIVVRPQYRPQANNHRQAPRRQKPPPGWELVTFQINDGNRTIHVRRFVRRPPGAANGNSGSRPLSNFFLVRPQHDASVAAAQEDTATAPAAADDLQEAETIGLPSGAPGFGNNLSHTTKNKLAKFLSLFTVIRFANTPCPTAEGVPGTCYHRLECLSMGGLASGTCAHGYGVCCLFQLTCGGHTAQNCSYFVNPGWPSATAVGAAAMNCEISVEKLPGVTQMRLDLLSFDLARPTNGMCIDEQFVVSGQNMNSIVPILCGDNNGQHVYADVDAVRGPVRMAALGGAGARYRIKVTQLRDGDARSAPRGCAQYFMGVRGILRSFNFAGGSYTNDLNYAICIRKEAGYCSVTYTVRSGNSTDTSFQLVNVGEDGEPLVPPGQAGAEAFNCPDDYIVVGGLRLCGDRLNDASVQLDFTQNAPVTDTTNGPFIVTVRTNGNTVGRGFELDYRQNLCR